MIRVELVRLYKGPNLLFPGPGVAALIGCEAPLGGNPAALIKRVQAQLPRISSQIDFNEIAKNTAEGSVSEHYLVAWIIAKMADVLFRRAGGAVKRAGIAPAKKKGTAVAFLEGADPLKPGEQALRAAAAALEQCFAPEAGDAPNEKLVAWLNDGLRSLARGIGRHGIDLNTKEIVRVAEKRGIPWFKLFDLSTQVVLGWGKHKHVISELSSERSSVIGTRVAKHKALTADLLRQNGIRAPQNMPTPTLKDAEQAAQKLGYPVVVKPATADKGIGITVGVRNAEELRAAFERADREDKRNVIVEQFIPGDEHRILVINGKVAAAAKRMPAQVVGDGQSTVAQLMAAENKRNKLRGKGYSNFLQTLEPTEEALSCLKQAGMTMQSVPGRGQVVKLARMSNISQGGTSLDVTQTAHPDNLRLAERAAMALDLDMAGVDFLTRDIAKSWREVGGAICEVNSTPGMRPHYAAPNRSVEPANAVVDYLFPNGGNGRVPVAAVTGTTGKSTSCNMLAAIMRAAGLHPGVATTQGVNIGGEWIARGDMAGGSGMRMVFLDKTVDSAVIEVARGGIVKYGVPLDRCDVACVTMVEDDHLGVEDVDTLEEMAAVKTLLAQTAAKGVVLNADNAYTIAMRANLKAPEICFVSMHEDNATVAEHRAAGGAAAFLAKRNGSDMLVLAKGVDETPLLTAGELPATFNGIAPHNAQNALFASAMAMLMGLSVEAMQAGLRGFVPDWETNPGRMNLLEANGVTILFDYAHCEIELRTVVAFTKKLKIAGRRTLVFTSPGNRRNEHYDLVAGAAAGHFDRYICMRGPELRGREHEEVAKLLARGLEARGVSREAIETVPLAPDAIDRALAGARPGDLVVICTLNGNDAWRRVEAFIKGGRAQAAE